MGLAHMFVFVLPLYTGAAQGTRDKTVASGYLSGKLPFQGSIAIIFNFMGYRSIILLCNSLKLSFPLRFFLFYFGICSLLTRFELLRMVVNDMVFQFVKMYLPATVWAVFWQAILNLP